nr:reverse transcriptase domain-containing protein [Tanacetum cinerariifolium]
MEDNIEDLVDGQVITQQDFDKLKTELQEARTQISGFQRKQMGHNDKIALARFRIFILKIIIEDIHVRHQSNMKSLLGHTPPSGTPVARKEFIRPTYWNRTSQQDHLDWIEKENKYCPRTKVKKMEDEFYNLTVKENDLKTYVRRFQELAVLCPNMVPNTKKLMEVFIEGLPQSIEGTVTASKPQTLEEATNIAQKLMDQLLKCDSMQGTNDHK